MIKTTVPIACDAWIQVSTAEGRIRRCVLADGHYVEEVGDQSWHTDCPNVAGQNRPLTGQDQDHPGRPCRVWADWADGAGRGPDSTTPPATRETEPDPDALPDFTVPPLNEAAPLADLATPEEYSAALVIGISELHVRGSHRVVANLVRAFADAFEEEVER